MPNVNNAAHTNSPDSREYSNDAQDDKVITLDMPAPEAVDAFIAQVRFNADGLVAAIAQDSESGEILMLAWQNAESLRQTLTTGEMVYFSRSRQALWHKGETSGHTQRVHRLLLDCDGDAILAEVTQKGGIACHTGRKSCFYRAFSATDGVIDDAPVLKDPKQIYSDS